MSVNHGVVDTNVRPANNEPTSKVLQPKTLSHMSEMKMFACEVGDENGVKRMIVAFRVGGQWYHDPVGNQWLDRLRPIDKKSWLAEKLEGRFQDANVPTVAPKEDAVDIMGG